MPDRPAEPSVASASFPQTRMRRLRHHPGVRAMIVEHRLHPKNFILPLFVKPGKNQRKEIGSMPGHAQLRPI
ncbi:MAG: hypothetical protein QM811_20865 [Pirellulales bacterium]